MLNSRLKNSGPDHMGISMRTSDKQTPGTAKKAVLTDLQNANRNLMHNHQEDSLFLDQRPFADTIKFCGTKRLRTESPAIRPFCQNPTLSGTDPKEHRTYAHNNFKIEPERERIYSELRHLSNMQQEIPCKQTQIRNNNLHYVPIVTPNHLAPKMTLSYVPPSLPSSLDKPSSGVKADERDSLKASSETPYFPNFKRADQKRDERYIHLQNSLKRCDESDNSDLLQRLLQLSPADLSMYAFELERKSIQLAIEEGKEMQRMKALNVLGKSPTTTDRLQTTQLPKPMKMK